MLPSVVFTHRNGAQFAARLPEPVTIGEWAQPAFSTAGQHDRPSVTTLAPGSIAALASFSISRLRKPLTTVSRRRLGRLSAVVSTAASLRPLTARRNPSADAIPPPDRPWNPRESYTGSGWVSRIIRKGKAPAL